MTFRHNSFDQEACYINIYATDGNLYCKTSFLKIKPSLSINPILYYKQVVTTYAIYGNASGNAEELCSKKALLYMVTMNIAIT